MMKPLTAAEVRERIALAPADQRAAMLEIAWSSFDMGITAGLAGEARVQNPFEQLLPAAERALTRGKR